MRCKSPLIAYLLCRPSAVQDTAYRLADPMDIYLSAPCNALSSVGSEVPEQSICVSLTTQRLPVRRIKTYTIKEGPMKAVIFITRRGIKVCADPQDKWVKAAIKSVDNRSSTRKDMIQSKPTTTQQTASTAVTLTG
ncbi:lymphotactin-like isoform 2-T2 [Thomomys bottae]